MHPSSERLHGIWYVHAVLCQPSAEQYNLHLDQGRDARGGLLATAQQHMLCSHVFSVNNASQHADMQCTVSLCLTVAKTLCRDPITGAAHWDQSEEQHLGIDQRSSTLGPIKGAARWDVQQVHSKTRQGVRTASPGPGVQGQPRYSSAAQSLWTRSLLPLHAAANVSAHLCASVSVPIMLPKGL